MFKSLVEKTEFYTATPRNKNKIIMKPSYNCEVGHCGPIAYTYTCM